MFSRFLVVGSLGFGVDAGVTHALIWAGVDPVWARPPAIAAAMLFTWLANRRYTFRTERRASWREGAAYAAVALGAAGVNWAVYAVAVTRGLLPLAAIVLSTLVQMGFSYFGYKHLVFRPAAGPGAKAG